MRTIQSPGKFEGEPTYAPAFWNVVLDNGADFETYDGNTIVAGFVLTRDDIAKWSDFESDDVGNVLTLAESSDGFVYSAIVTRADWERFEADCYRTTGGIRLDETDDETDEG